MVMLAVAFVALVAGAAILVAVLAWRQELEVHHDRPDERRFLVRSKDVLDALWTPDVPLLGSKDPERGRVIQRRSEPTAVAGEYIVTARYEKK